MEVRLSSVDSRLPPTSSLKNRLPVRFITYIVEHVRHIQDHTVNIYVIR